MISSKIFYPDGSINRFLSDFIIRSEQYARPYVYIYDDGLDPDGSEDELEGGGTDQADWSYPDNLWKRGLDVAQSDDLVAVDKWAVVDNSILYYVAPPADSTFWLEVATTSEEFGSTLAQPSAERAETAADEAVVSAAAAAASESAAAASESAAGTSETNAGTSETNAAASESAASTSETNAAASESAASTSETNAAASESAAGTSETNAAASESAASTSETNAAASESAAQASLDEFTGIYHGVFASDPVSADEGDMYFYSVTKKLKIYNGTAWDTLDPVVSGASAREAFVIGSASGDYDGVSLTTFPIDGGYDAGHIDVFVNGLKLINGVDVTVTSGVNVVLATAGISGHNLDVLLYGVSTGSGDMSKATYDPTSVEGDAFDVDNHVDGTTNKVYTATEKTKLSGVSTGADVTSANETSHADVVVDGDIGTTVQAYSATNVLDADVTYELLDTNGDVGTGAGQLAIGNHTHTGVYEPNDAGLTSIAGLTTAADKMIYTTASDTYAVATLTTAGRALLDDASASAQRTRCNSSTSSYR